MLSVERSTMLRRTILSVVIVLLATVGLAASGRPVPTRLRVAITGLPPGVVAHVGVAGPAGTHYTLTATDERRVPAGVYRVTIESVRSVDTTFHPADERHEVLVEPGRTTLAAAPYRVAIPDTTEVLDPDDPGILEIRGLRVVFAAGSPQAAALQPGDHLISGIGTRVPHMLVRRVAAMHYDGDRVVVDTQPATFDEALPAGVIRLDLVDGLTLLRPAAFAHGDEPEPLVEFSRTLSFEDSDCSPAENPPGRSSGERSSAGSLAYKLDTVDLDLDGEFAWDGIVNPTVSTFIGAAMTLEGRSEAEFTMAVKCSVKSEHDIQIGCASVLARIVRIGPIRLGCDFKVVGEAFAAAEGSWKSEAMRSRTSLGFEVGYRSESGGFHRDRFLVGEEFAEKPTAPQVEFSFGVSAGLSAELTGKDPFGIAELTVALDVKVGPTVISDSAGFRGDFKAVPTVAVGARLGRGFLKWEGEAKVPLPGLELNLWSIERPPAPPSASPSASPSPAPLSLSPTVGDRMSTERQRRAFETWFIAQHLDDGLGVRADDLDFDVVVADDLDGDALLDFIVLDRTVLYCGSAGCWTTVYLTQSLGSYTSVGMFGVGDEMAKATVRTRSGSGSAKDVIVTEKFVSQEPLYSVYTMRQGSYSFSHWEYCAGDVFETCQPVVITPLRSARGTVAPGTTPLERPSHDAKGITVGLDGQPYEEFVGKDLAPIGVLLDGEWYLVDVWKGFSGFVPASAVER
ncbi:hypothetical protein [Micromonospora craniellae]|uniref:Uncharacterized protein n=1 Tax=Micromonospora craniellae TaxID=2294034 RepID=A0A372FSH0_9ACTN|nr:hypothetical protein [Micromonospora craniellae]QOC94360.1 hypothetical protein ID554_12665 [Micromonospora craniellae]RFS43732.1 hypothetical protein D0Q02_26000 [Micromonospora craniellae]